MQYHRFIALCGCAAIFLLSSVANAYMVGPALSLEKLEETAGIVFKGVVVSSQPITDPLFEPVSGFAPRSTVFKIVAVYKGANSGEQVSFRHYAETKDAPFLTYLPQHYEFETGRTYIVFAEKTKEGTLFRQLWKQHKSQEDQGVLLAADDSIHPKKSIKEIFWLELTGLLKSKQPKDVIYAVNHLNQMSGGETWRATKDFPRDDVLKELLPLITHSDNEISTSAIRAVSSNNPLMDEGLAAGWLATIGHGHIPGYAAWDQKTGNPGGKRLWKELAAIADSDIDAKHRSLAIRSLGLAKVPELRPHVIHWIGDPDESIVQSAIILLSDYLEDSDHELLKTLSKDPRDPVRIGVATAIGFAQAVQLIPLLGEMVDDADERVSSTAALSLLSFSLDRNEEVLKSKLKHGNFAPLFVNALAQKNGLVYADELCDIICNNRQPKNWWGGFVIWGDSWNILFNAAQSASREELSGKRFENILKALEAPASGDLKSPLYYSSSEPRDLYALYLQKGLLERARTFRAQCKKTTTYDIDYFFKEADSNPDLYTRNRR